MKWFFILNSILIFIIVLEKIIHRVKVNGKRKVWQNGGKTGIDLENNPHQNHKKRKYILVKTLIAANIILSLLLIFL